MPIYYVALFVFFVFDILLPLLIFLFRLLVALPYPRIFLAVVLGINEGLRLTGSAVRLFRLGIFPFRCGM